MAIELVGMCVESDEVRSKLPYTSRHLLADRFPSKYIPGWVSSVVPGYPARFGSPSRILGDYKRLLREYRRAIRRPPAPG